MAMSMTCCFPILLLDLLNILFCNAITLFVIFCNFTMSKKNRMQNISLLHNLQKKMGCSKIHASSFLCKNREAKNTCEHINTPQLNTPLSHVVCKRLGVWPPQGLYLAAFLFICSIMVQFCLSDIPFYCKSLDLYNNSWIFVDINLPPLSIQSDVLQFLVSVSILALKAQNLENVWYLFCRKYVQLFCEWSSVNIRAYQEPLSEGEGISPIRSEWIFFLGFDALFIDLEGKRPRFCLPDKQYLQTLYCELSYGNPITLFLFDKWCRL